MVNVPKYIPGRGSDRGLPWPRAWFAPAALCVACAGQGSGGASAPDPKAPPWHCVSRSFVGYGMCSRSPSACEAIRERTQGGAEFQCEPQAQAWCYRPPAEVRREGVHSCVPTATDCGAARAIFRERMSGPVRNCREYSVPTAYQSSPPPAPAAAPPPGEVEVWVPSHEELVKRCDTGDADSCFVAGDRLYNGEGVEHDVVGGAKYETRGCELGSEGACVSMARNTRKGVGVAKDPERGFELLEGSCSRDFPPACSALGQAYEFGVGTKKDPEAALVAYRKACRLEPAHDCRAVLGEHKKDE